MDQIQPGKKEAVLLYLDQWQYLLYGRYTSSATIFVVVLQSYRLLKPTNVALLLWKDHPM